MCGFGTANHEPSVDLSLRYLPDGALDAVTTLAIPVDRDHEHFGEGVPSPRDIAHVATQRPNNGPCPPTAFRTLTSMLTPNVRATRSSTPTMNPEFRSWWADEGGFRVVSPVFAGFRDLSGAKGVGTRFGR